MSDRAYRVYELETGTVIDHIPSGQGIKVLELLGADGTDALVTLGMNMDSKKYGKKDVVKIENAFLTPEETAKLALVAPTATINILKNNAVTEKHAVRLPEKIVGKLKCPNPNCVTNYQKELTVFHTEKHILRCHYCERSYQPKNMELL